MTIIRYLHLSMAATSGNTWRSVSKSRLLLTRHTGLVYKRAHSVERVGTSGPDKSRCASMHVGGFTRNRREPTFVQEPRAGKLRRERGVSWNSYSHQIKYSFVVLNLPWPSPPPFMACYLHFVVSAI